MFESFEVRKLKNGYLVIVAREDGEVEEYAFDTPRRLTKFINNELLKVKTSATE